MLDLYLGRYRRITGNTVRNMLEAVNSVLQTAPFVRPQAEQTAPVNSFAANPERVQQAAPQAPFVSPYIFVNVNFDKAVIQLRNGETGDVEDQFPSDAALEARARQAAVREATQQAAAQQSAAPPARRPQSAQESVQQATQQTQQAQQQQRAAITSQQQAAFAAAARAGNSNAGNTTVFA